MHKAVDWIGTEPCLCREAAKLPLWALCDFVVAGPAWLSGDKSCCRNQERSSGYWCRLATTATSPPLPRQLPDVDAAVGWREQLLTSGCDGSSPTQESALMKRLPVW